MTTAVVHPTRRRHHERAPWFLWVGAAAAAGASAIPLWYLADRIVDGGVDGLQAAFGGGRLLDLVVNSASLALVVGFGAAVVGTTTAWVVERVDLPGRVGWHVAATLPLAVPSYVSAYAWVSWFPSISGFWGAALVLVTVTAPIVHLSVGAGLRQVDRAQEDAARSLGWSSTRIFRRLTLPQLRRHLSGGVLLVVLYVLSDFGVVAVMRYEAFTWVIYGAYRAGFDPSRAAVLAGALVVLALVVVALEVLARGRRSTVTVTSRPATLPTRTSTTRARLAGVSVMAAAVGVSLGVPLVRSLVWVARDPGDGPGGGEFLSALWSTAMLTALATVATLAVAIPLAILVARHPSPASHLLERSVYVAHSLPGIVMAIAFVFVGVQLLRPLYLTVPLLVMAYVAIVASLAVGAIRASAERIPPGLDESARSLGWSRGRVLRSVILPLTRGGIAAAAALVSLTVLKELPTTLLLRPTGLETLATRTWTYASVSDDSAVGPYSLALIVLSVIPACFLALRRPEDAR